jgi:hypothetical protein
MSDIEIANKLRGAWDVATVGYGGNFTATQMIRIGVIACLAVCECS